MAGNYTWTKDQDTLASIAADTVSADPVQTINDAGETLLPELARRGRVFLVNDSERYQAPILWQDGGGTIVEYKADDIGTPGNSLDAASKEILTMSYYDMVSASRNINYPQDMPPGNMGIDFHEQLMRSSGIGLFQREESLIVNGTTAAGPAIPGRNAPFEAKDADYNEDKPFSLLGLLASGTANSGGDGDDGGFAGTGTDIQDKTDETFAGIEVDEVPKWAPQQAAGTANGSALETDLEGLLLNCTFSGVESPDVVLVGDAIYKQLVKLHRDRMAPGHLVENPATVNRLPFGPVEVLRHGSMLNTKATRYDLDGDTTAEYPIYMLNLKSLRLNIVRQEMSVGEGFGFLRMVTPQALPHPQNANLFRRVSWKRSLGLDNGRRSFGFLHGVTL